MPPSEPYNPISPTINATYIPNASYFMAPHAPTHGENTVGTCTAVAVQLLLSYNNYYHDRRIIDNIHLNAHNPHNILNPMDVSSEILGSNQAYHDFIVSNYMTGSKWLTFAKTWLTNLLNYRNTQISGNINFTVNTKTGWPKSISSSIVLAELNAGRPIAIAMDEALNGSNHSVVAYGYETFAPYAGNPTSYLGYIVHYGWDHNGIGNKVNVWTNSAWYYECLTLKINHTHNHNIVTGNIIDGQNMELQCECNHRKTDNIFTVSGNTVTGLKYALTSAVSIVIPESINNVPITAIGNSAFSNQTGINAVTIPNTVTSIGTYAFSQLPGLIEVEIPASVSAIGANAFWNSQSLQRVWLPESAAGIGENAFAACPALDRKSVV